MNASASNVENFWRKCQHIFTHFKFPYENCFPDKNLNLCSYIILFLLQWQVYGITKKFVKKWTKIQSWTENIVGISRISMNFLFSNPSFICNDLIMEVLSDYVSEWLKRISLRMLYFCNTLLEGLMILSLPHS